jgi:uncharacterized membrane protein YebE (DUF533 family)
MFDPQRLLGMMLGTGLGGNNRRNNDLLSGLGAALGGSGGGGSLGDLLSGGQGNPDAARRGGAGQPQSAGLGSLGKLGGAAGIAILGAMALRALEARRERSGDAAAPAADATTRTPATDQLDEGESLLLIRAMIAAANCDGQIDAEERRRILGRLEEAGASREDRDFVGREMENPAGLNELLRDVRDKAAAERFYAASAFAITADTPAEQSYLRYLADRLGLERQRSESLLQSLGIGARAV